MDFLLFNELDALLNTLDLVLILVIDLELFATLAFGVELTSIRVKIVQVVDKLQEFGVVLDLLFRDPLL